VLVWNPLRNVTYVPLLGCSSTYSISRLLGVDSDTGRVFVQCRSSNSDIGIYAIEADGTTATPINMTAVCALQPDYNGTCVAGAERPFAALLVPSTGEVWISCSTCSLSIIVGNASAPIPKLSACYGSRGLVWDDLTQHVIASCSGVLSKISPIDHSVTSLGGDDACVDSGLVQHPTSGFIYAFCDKKGVVLIDTSKSRAVEFLQSFGQCRPGAHSISMDSSGTVHIVSSKTGLNGSDVA
jgi:hypothetical protein